MFKNFENTKLSGFLIKIKKKCFNNQYVINIR